MTEKAPNKRQIKSNETKIRIYKSAGYLFSINGFNDVSVDDIVKHANVAKGSFYVHFNSKDELIALLFEDYVKKIDADYQAFLKTIPTETPAGEVLLSLVGRIADVITDTLGFENTSMLYKAYLTSDVKTHSATNYNRELYKIFYNIIAKGMEQSAFHSDCSAEDTARHFVTAYRGLIMEWCIRYPDFDLKEQALHLFKIMLAGITVK